MRTSKLKKRKYSAWLTIDSNRFGLFNAPAPVAIGENKSFGVKPFPEKDEMGKVVTAPRNFYASPNQGKTPD